MNPHRARLHRWADVLWLTVAAFTALCVIDTCCGPVRAWTNETIGNWPEWLAWVCSGVVLIGVTLGLKRMGGAGAWDVRDILAYPPAWLATVLSLVLSRALASWGLFPQLLAGIGEIRYAPLFLVVLLCVLLGHLIGGTQRIRERRNGHVGEFAHRSQPAAERLLLWLGREEPVSDDLFDRSGVVDRLTRRLRDPTVRSIGLIGPKGSGKSTVLMLAERALARQHTRIWFTRVDAWGLSTGAAATQHVLSCVVAQLAQRADCIAIGSLPRQYHEALTGSGSTLATVASALTNSSSSSPEDQLQRLDPILTALNVEMVILIEDLDRDVPDAALAEVQAMLDRLRTVKSIKFVLSFGHDISVNASKLPTIDFARLCEFSEVLLPLPQVAAWDVIAQFRREMLCLAERAGDIDPLGVEARKEQCELQTDVWSAFFGGNSIAPAITEMLSTPRQLKAALRRTHAIWTALHGEIDLDGALACCALRESVPQVFNFLLLHDIPDDPEQNAFLKHSSDAKRLWAMYNETVDSSPRPEDVRRVLLWAFGTRLPQSMSLGKYWERLNAERQTDSLSDQHVLHVMRDWASGTFDAGTVERLAKDAEFAESFEHFAITATEPSLQVSGALILRLASQILRLVRESGQKEVHDGHPGLAALWGLASRKRIEGYEEWLLAEWDLCAKGSLSLASGFGCYWASPAHMPLNSAGVELMGALLARTEKLFDGDANALLASLDARSPSSCRHLRSMPGQFGDLPADCWRWLAHLLLDASKTCPVKAVPELMYLLTDDEQALEENGPVHRRRLDAELLASVFPDATVRRSALRLMSETHDFGFAAETSAALDQIRPTALAMLKKLGSAGNGPPKS